MPFMTRPGVVPEPIEPGRAPAVRLAVRLRAAPEVVALHDAREALALAGADDVDTLALASMSGVDLVAQRDAVQVRRRHLAQDPHVRRAGRLQVPALRAVQLVLAYLLETKLDRLVAILIERLDLRDEARPDLDDRRRDSPLASNSRVIPSFRPRIP